MRNYICSLHGLMITPSQKGRFVIDKDLHKQHTMVMSWVGRLHSMRVLMQCYIRLWHRKLVVVSSFLSVHK